MDDLNKNTIKEIIAKERIKGVSWVDIQTEVLKCVWAVRDYEKILINRRKAKKE